MYNIYSGLNLSTFDFTGLSYIFISSHQFGIVLFYFFQTSSKGKTFKTHRSLNIPQKVSDSEQTVTSYTLFIWVKQSVDLSVHPLWSLEGQRFCCLLGFFLKRRMETFVFLIWKLVSLFGINLYKRQKWMLSVTEIMPPFNTGSSLCVLTILNPYGIEIYCFHPNQCLSYLIWVDEILLTDGTVIFSSGQLQDIPYISTSSHNYVYRWLTLLSNVYIILPIRLAHSQATV